jgi:hypothetical protein
MQEKEEWVWKQGTAEKQRIFWNRKRDLSLFCLWRRLTYLRLSSCFHKTTPNSVNGVQDGVDLGFSLSHILLFFNGVLYSAFLWDNRKSCDPITTSQTSVCITGFNRWRFNCSGVGCPADSYLRFGSAYCFHLQGSLTNLLIFKSEAGNTL